MSRPTRGRSQYRPGLHPHRLILINPTQHRNMKTKKHTCHRATVSLYQKLQANREKIIYQHRVIADLRKQLNDLNNGKENELDKAINRLHGLAKSVAQTARQDLELTTSMTYGTPGI